MTEVGQIVGDELRGEPPGAVWDIVGVLPHIQRRRPLNEIPKSGREGLTAQAVKAWDGE
jgi:hypothetical protein